MAKEVKDREKTRKFSLKNLQMNRRFLVLSLIFVIAIVTIAFSTQSLFDTNIDAWNVTQGSFQGSDGTLQAITSSFNWAYHSSEVAYGEWEWSFKYSDSGSASVIFIGLNQDEDYYNRSSKGYKLQIEYGKAFQLLRRESESNEIALASSYVALEESYTYIIKITRSLENNFTVYCDDKELFTVIDSTFTTSEVFELDWYNKHTLNWVQVTGINDENSWSEYFTGLPTAESANLFTIIALYTPFVALGLVLIFYALKLLLTEGSWTRFIVPLLIAVIIGVGFGYLFDYVRTWLAETEIPSDTYDTNTEEGSISYTTPPMPSNGSDNSYSSSGVSPVIPPLEKLPISIILLIVSGLFIVITIGFVMIDFFRKREEEYHETILEKDARWMPQVTEKDFRKRVIRAYHKSSYDLIDRGVKSERSMTPGEFKENVYEDIDLSDDSFESLTDLYEEARFSEHDIDEAKSSKAETLSGKISSDLKKKQSQNETDFEDSNEENGEKENE